MYKPYRIIGQEQPSVLTDGFTLISQVAPARYPLALTDRSWDTGSPFALTYDGASPIVYNAAGEPSSALKAWRVRMHYSMVARRNDPLDVPLPIASIPPDDVLLQWEHFGAEGRPAASVAAQMRSAQHTVGGLVQEGLIAPSIPASEYLVDSCAILSEIQAHLLETTIDDGVTWSLWSQDEVLDYLNERVSRFLLETGAYRAQATVNMVAGTSVYALPSDMIELRAISVGGSKLLPTSKWELDHGSPGWQSLAAGAPQKFLQWPEDALTFRVVPTPDGSYTATVHYIPNAPTITGVCVHLPIPATFSWGIKYGVMADMLSKQGEANDPVRAQHCEARFKEAVEMALALHGESGGE